MPHILTDAELAKLGKPNFTACYEPSEFELVAADPGQPEKLPSFSMTAYTGVAMNVGYSLPVVVDLAGMAEPSANTQILRNHDFDRIVGHSESVEKTQRRLKVWGVVSGVGRDADEVVRTSKNKFPWQASIGASIQRMEWVKEGEKVNVNGMNFQGPIYVARQSTLTEVSFVARGADSATSASIAATHHERVRTMPEFDLWLQANGFDAATVTDTQRPILQAQFDASKKPVTKPAADNVDPVAQHRDLMASQYVRDGVIRQHLGEYPELAATATREGWDDTRIQHEAKREGELRQLRAGRPGSPAIHVNDRTPTSDVLEAAICMTRGHKDLEKQFNPETLEAAHKNFRRIGLQQAVMICAAANGYHASAGERINTGNIRDVLHHAFLRANFSTVSLATTLGNIANKEILAGYMEEDQTWREIAAVRSVSDFKQVTSFRLLDNLEYEELAPDGRIKHGTLGEETYTRQVKTYAKMLGISRTDLINDDMGAFDDIKRRIGRGAAKKLSNLAWAKFMNNASFFTAGRGNYISGSTTNLGTDGVGLALGAKAFYELKSPTADGAKKVGMTVGGRPTKLVVPPALMFNAQALYMATAPGATSQNQFAGMYKPVVSPWLSDSAFTGYSSTAWYLLRDPSDMAAVVVSFLNGQETPTVESTDADFDQLGILFRGFHDFGADQAEYLAGVMSKGAA